MRRRSETGHIGEELAAKYLTGQGFEVLHRNLRIGHLETDIICENGEHIVFAEVKTRRKVDRYLPGANLSDLQKKRIGLSMKTPKGEN